MTNPNCLADETCKSFEERRLAFIDVEKGRRGWMEAAVMMLA
jgi:hypothetical protein